VQSALMIEMTSAASKITLVTACGYEIMIACEPRPVSDAGSLMLYETYAIPCADRVLFEGAFDNFVAHSPAHIDVKSRPAADSAHRGRSRPSGDAGVYGGECSAHLSIAGPNARNSSSSAFPRWRKHTFTVPTP
jgi:hypothetical protein